MVALGGSAVSVRQLIVAALALALVIGAQTVFRPPGGTPAQTQAYRNAYDESPARVSAVIYSLARTPAPEASLRVYLNGCRLRRGVDYAVNGATVTFITHWSDVLEDSARILVADYEY